MISASELKIIKEAVLRIINQHRRLEVSRYGHYYGDQGSEVISPAVVPILEGYFENLIEGSDQ